jgi:hypothetical protein
MLLTRRKPHNIARPDFLDVAAFPLGGASRQMVSQSAYPAMVSRTSVGQLGA